MELLGCVVELIALYCPVALATYLLSDDCTELLSTENAELTPVVEADGSSSSSGSSTKASKPLTKRRSSGLLEELEVL